MSSPTSTTSLFLCSEGASVSNCIETAKQSRALIQWTQKLTSIYDFNMLFSTRIPCATWEPQFRTIGQHRLPLLGNKSRLLTQKKGLVVDQETASGARWFVGIVPKTAAKHPNASSLCWQSMNNGVLARYESGSENQLERCFDKVAKKMFWREREQLCVETRRECMYVGTRIEQICEVLVVTPS